MVDVRKYHLGMTKQCGLLFVTNKSRPSSHLLQTDGFHVLRKYVAAKNDLVYKNLSPWAIYSDRWEVIVYVNIIQNKVHFPGK